MEVKVGDTINLAENQSLTIHDSVGISAPADYVKFADQTLMLDSSGNTNIAIGAVTEDTYVYDTLGDNIVVDGAAVGAVLDTTNWLPINAYYEITGVPTSSTTGTLPDNTSWIYLKNYPDRLRILFNKEFYQFADNQHTTGTLVFSHVGYEGSELIIKTITITIATRGWVLTTVKPATQYTYYYSSSASYYVCFSLPGTETPTSLSYTPRFINASGWYKNGAVYYPITRVEFTGPNNTIKIYYLHPENGEISSNALSSPAVISYRNYDM